MEELNFVEIKKDELIKIKELWQKLNSHHHERSSDFKDHFKNFTFEKRIKEFDSKENIITYAYESKGVAIAYIIATEDNGKGEIDSLFINENFRGMGLGKKLMQKAFSWLKSLDCKNIIILVAHGNEEAIPFYEEFGFKKRFHALQLIEE